MILESRACLIMLARLWRVMRPVCALTLAIAPDATEELYEVTDERYA